MKCEDQLKLIPFQSFTFGSMTVRIYKSDELQQVQLGYSVDPDGNTLISGEERSWKENWLVIAYEDLCGDPIFVDVLAEGCPVYTATHGTGSWNPVLIADGIEGFAKALSVISGVAKGRGTPVALERNPLPRGERDKAIEEIGKNNPKADLSFWQDWIALE